MCYLGSAGGAWAAAALVTAGGAGVAAVWTGQRAGLLAAALGRQTLGPVADPPAAVHLARQRLVARQAAGDVLQVARDVAALLRGRRGREKRRADQVKVC